MKGNEITKDQYDRWDKDGWFPVCCRICGEVMLYPKENYKKEWFIGWECGSCKNRWRID